MEKIDPKQFGLPGRTVIHQTGKNEYSLVVDRKSRIIMADGKKILKKVEAIKNVTPEVKIRLKTSAPVCSKTTTFLNEHSVAIDLLVRP